MIDLRAAWEEHEVVCDPVSSRVLVLNLRLRGDAACARLTEAAGPEPLWLTWRSGSRRRERRCTPRAGDDAAGQEIIASLRAVIPGLSLWRFALRPRTPRATKNKTSGFSWPTSTVPVSDTASGSRSGQ
ncbi:MAG: hypothetical protein ACM32E_12180 [Gemmatimonadota bacterium]